MKASTEPRVEHVIVLMLENRSFDHMLGFLPRSDPFNGLQAGGYHNVGPDGVSVPATADGGPSDAAPDHSHEGVLTQIAGYGDVPANGGFVVSYARASGDPTLGRWVMQCLDPHERIPVLAQLADEFALCDAWFSSVPGETWPNRNFAHAATSDGAVNIELGFYYDRTIFEQLARGGATWRIYHDGVAQAWCFRNLWRHRLNWFDRLFGRRPTLENWYEQAEFYDHVRAEDLPSYAFIEPSHISLPGENRATNNQHPDNNRRGSIDFYAGEKLIKTVYQALVDRPALFEKTLLVVTYDEHGGFYDHQSPPPATPPGGRVLRSRSRRIGRLLREWWARLWGRPVPKRARYKFDRLGVRVPAVLISPWIKAGTLVETQLEHASIPATLQALFLAPGDGKAGRSGAPPRPSLTARDANANTFHHVVRTSGLSEPRHPGPPPEPDNADRGGPTRLPHLRNTIVPMPPRDADAAGPPSKLDESLLDLSQQVRDQLKREKPAGTGEAPAGRAGRDSVDATRPASVADEFADAARAARKNKAR